VGAIFRLSSNGHSKYFPRRDLTFRMGELCGCDPEFQWVTFRRPREAFCRFAHLAPRRPGRPGRSHLLLSKSARCETKPNGPAPHLPSTHRPHLDLLASNFLKVLQSVCHACCSCRFRVEKPLAAFSWDYLFGRSFGNSLLSEISRTDGRKMS